MEKTEDSNVPPPPYIPSSDVESASKPVDVESDEKAPAPKTPGTGFHWPDNLFFRTYTRRYITFELSLLFLAGIITFAVLGGLGKFGKKDGYKTVCARWVRGKDMISHQYANDDMSLHCTHWAKECTRENGDSVPGNATSQEKEIFSKIPHSNSCVDWVAKPTATQDPVTGLRDVDCVFWGGGGHSFDVALEPPMLDGKPFVPPSMSCVQWKATATPAGDDISKCSVWGVDGFPSDGTEDELIEFARTNTVSSMTCQVWAGKPTSTLMQTSSRGFASIAITGVTFTPTPTATPAMTSV